MKLKILKDIKIVLSSERLYLKEGEKREFNEDDAKRLIQRGYAEELKPSKKEKVIEPEQK